MTIRIRSIAAFAVTALLMAGPVHAVEPGPWALESAEGTCHIEFQNEPYAEGIWTILQHDSVCPAALMALSAYSENNDGQSIMLYTTANGLEMTGRVDREDDRLYVGMVGDLEVSMTRP